MRIATSFILIAVLITSVGCSTTQNIVLSKPHPTKTVVTVAQVPQADNSADMNTNLQSALQKESLTMKASLPAGTRTSPEVDALVSYTDVWRWDLAMYLKDLTVNLYAAGTGDLLLTGQWSDSALHAFRDSKVVMQGLVSEMMSKLRAATPTTSASN